MLDQDRIRKLLTARIDPRLTSFRIQTLRGDASNRTYHRIRFSSRSPLSSLILMELSEPEAFKKSEEKITRSSMAVTELPFINIQRHLGRSGVSVPEVFYYDRRAGWVFLEDLGDQTVEAGARKWTPVALHACYARAVDQLIRIQSGPARGGRCIAFGREMDLPLMMWEFDHFLEFGLPHCAAGRVRDADQKQIRRQFRALAAELAELPRVFTHRDFHSRNLMVHRKKIRVLDFQDALMGPYVYDLASLLRDSYTTLDEPTVVSLLDYYRSRMKVRPKPAARTLRRDFDLMSIQRNLKAVGRFVYIQKVKGNPRFLRYIPRTLRYVRGNLERYPELATLCGLLGPHLRGRSRV